MKINTVKAKNCFLTVFEATDDKVICYVRAADVS